MFKGDPGAREDAGGMFTAVKGGGLAGIYIVDQGVPALRAQKMNLGWWQVIPSGEDAVLLLDPADLIDRSAADCIPGQSQIRSFPAGPRSAEIVEGPSAHASGTAWQLRGHNPSPSGPQCRACRSLPGSPGRSAQARSA